jgi:cyclic pyranopterin phosphate synthase
MKGLDAAKEAGLRIKINTVALKGFNEDELEQLVTWCGDEGHDLTYIEVMPMGDMGELDRLGQFWSLEDVRAQVEKHWAVTDTTETTGGPARYVRLTETGQKIGFITPLSHNFCENCNRVRVTCTGEIYQCLGQESRVDLRAPLRADQTDVALNKVIDLAIGKKPKGHDFDYSSGKAEGQMSRHMSHTGG